MTRVVRTVSDTTFVDVVLGCATTCLVEFGRSTDHDGRESGWLADLAQANQWLTCARIDVSTNPQTARAYDIGAVPTFLIFQLGAVVSSANRAADLPALLESLSRAPSPDLS